MPSQARPPLEGNLPVRDQLATVLLDMQPEECHVAVAKSARAPSITLRLYYSTAVSDVNLHRTARPARKPVPDGSTRSATLPRTVLQDQITGPLVPGYPRNREIGGLLRRTASGRLYAYSSVRSTPTPGNDPEPTPNNRQSTVRTDPKRTHRRRRSMHNPTVGQVGNPCLPFVRLGSCNRFRFGQASREIRGTKRVGGIQEFCVESCFLNRTIAYKASIPIEFESLNVKAHCGQAPGKSTATSLASSTNRLKTDAAPY